MLLYDKRYRSLTIQIFVAVPADGGRRLAGRQHDPQPAALGKDFSFRFLWQRAGYDINQRLIEYDSP
jgi:general L-amino acid transport system permease protein